MFHVSKTQEKIIKGPHGTAKLSDGKVVRIELVGNNDILDTMTFRTVAELEAFLVDANELHKMLKQEGL